MEVPDFYSGLVSDGDARYVCLKGCTVTFWTYFLCLKLYNPVRCDSYSIYHPLNAFDWAHRPGPRLGTMHFLFNLWTLEQWRAGSSNSDWSLGNCDLSDLYSPSLSHHILKKGITSSLTAQSLSHPKDPISGIRNRSSPSIHQIQVSRDN